MTILKERKNLQALIYEGIRIRAPATGLYPKTVPPQGDTVDGKFIPGGTAIGMNAPGLLKSSALFGPDADLFRPERFLEVDDDAARLGMERDVEMAFGYGRYMCAGKPVAFMELYKAFFEVSFFLVCLTWVQYWGYQLLMFTV